MHVDGSCHCGSIRFSAEIDPGTVMVCHCTDCQKLTGSAFRVVVPAPIESFILHGEPTRYVKVAESGSKRVQAFCPACGSSVFSVGQDNPAQVSLRVGVLDQRNELLPSLQIWKRSALPWVDTLPSVCASEQQEALQVR